MPQGINQAIIGIWVSIGCSAIASLLNIWTGAISHDEFVLYLIILALYCIFPYKIAKGSNPARWIYTVLAVTGYLFLLGGGGGDVPSADLAVAILTLPIEIFIIFRLFQPEAEVWFSQTA